MLQYVPNDDYQYGNARIKAFMTYLKDTTNRSNSEILCVTDANICIIYLFIIYLSIYNLFIYL